MIQSYDLYMPTHLIFGKGRISELKDAVAGAGKKALITYGGGSVKRSGLFTRVKELLESAGCTVSEFGGVEPNPKITSVREGVSLCKDEGIDFVVAVGGGSVLDASKAICCGAMYPGDPWDLVLDAKKIKAYLPLFDVITLAATGSEYDRAGVISNEETKEKLTIWGNFPVTSILDPEYTMTVPANQTAAGIADIMSHTFEQYIVRDGNMLSDGFCESMLRTVTHFGPIAVKDPTNYEARAEILAASSFGCCGLLALGRTPSPWPCHGMEHELSAWYDITHGVGLAILTPNWMRWCLETDPTTVNRFAQYGVNVWKLNPRHDPMENAKDAIANTRKFFDSIGIPNTLGALGIDDTHFGEMADHIKVCWGDLGKAFVPLDRDAIITVLRMSL